MKCAEIMEWYGLPNTDPNYAEVEAHLRQCFICRARWDDQDAVRALIALKRYEQPAPDRVARNRAAIHARLAAPPKATPVWRGALAGWTAPRFVWAAAAALLALLGSIYYFQPAGAPAPATLPPLLAQDGRVSIRPPDAPPLFLTSTPPVFITATNRGSGRMDYGPGETMPVKFNY